jgi:hypothetical protein
LKKKVLSYILKMNRIRGYFLNTLRGVSKMVKKIILAALVSGLIWGCAGGSHRSADTEIDNGQPPVIVDSYAPEVIRWGTTWRVYLQAEDADGDIKDIAAVMWQAGVGFYPTSVTRIEGDNRKGFTGYLFLWFPAQRSLMWDQFNLQVLVRDEQGNKSESANLTLKIDEVPATELPAEWQIATQNRLGAIMIEVVSSEIFNRDAGDRRRLIR